MQPRDLSDHTEYVPGEGLKEVARELGVEMSDLVALASNENPYGPSDEAIEAVTSAAPEMNAYPKASHTDLQRALAEHWNVMPDQIWLSPGADGAIDYLSRAMLEPGDGLLCPEPGFSYYGMSGRYHHGTIRTYPSMDGKTCAVTSETVLQSYEDERLVYLTTPHNPTGDVLSLEEIETIAAETEPETLVVVDEAYGEFATVDSARELIADRTDVAVLRTFSKAYGLAGLRLGYAIVHDEWADAYAKISTPFAVSELACRAGLAALSATEHLERTIQTVREGRQKMTAEIDAPTWQSEGNFVMVDVGDAGTVAEALKRRGIIVRDCSSFGLPSCIRISCGTPSETRDAINAVNEVLTEATVDE